MSTELEKELAEAGFDKGQHTREGLIKRMPGLEKVLPEFEAFAGPLLTGGCAGRFKDGRFVMLFQHEHKYALVFWNPANPKESEEKNVWLSREAMCSLVGLYQLLGDMDRDAAAYMEHISPDDGAE